MDFLPDRKGNHSTSQVSQGERGSVMVLTRWLRSPQAMPQPSHRSVSRGRRLSVEPLEDRCLLSATLVRDILTDTDSSLPTNLVAVGSDLFFAAESGLL